MVVLCLETGANFLSRKHMNERSIHSPPSSSSFCGMDPKLESQSLLKLSSTSARAAQDSTGRSFPKQEGTHPNSTYIQFFFFKLSPQLHSCISRPLGPLQGHFPEPQLYHNPERTYGTRYYLLFSVKCFIWPKMISFVFAWLLVCQAQCEKARSEILSP